MSRLTGGEIGSLKETYASIYENVEVTENQIIESIAYTLISNGSSAVEVLEYFANVDYETFIEDINHYSSDDLIVENLSSEEYIEEQMQKLYEIAPLVGLGLGAAARAVLPAIGRTLFGAGARQAAKGALSGAARLGGKVLGNVLKGAKEPAKKALQTLGKWGVPTGIAAAADQFISGGKGREYVGAAVQSARQAAHNIPSPQKAADAIKNVKPPKLPELPATAKPKPTSQKSLKILGGKVVGYDHFDMVDNHSGELLDEATGRDFALKGGRPGFITPKGWFPIDTKTFDKKELDRLTADYARRRGSKQIEKDIETHKAEKAKQDAARKAAQQKPAATKPEPAKPAATKPEPAKPAATKAEPVAQTGDRTKNLSTWAKANEPMISKVGTSQQRAILAAAKSGSAMPAPRPISKDIEDLKKMQKASQERQAAQSGPMYSSPDVKSKMSSRTKTMLGLKDSYDIILDYLFSQGHVDTLEEALYVMMELSSETIQDIVEGAMPEPINPEAHRRLQRIEKATKLQQGSTGSESQAAGAAVKRMGGSGIQLPGV
jgi:hypothetical protein